MKIEIARCLLAYAIPLHVAGLIVHTQHSARQASPFGFDDAHTIEDAHNIEVGDEVVITSDPDELRSAFEDTHFKWTHSMNNILGKTLPVLQVADDGRVIGLEEAEQNSPSPVWFYPAAIVKNILKGAQHAIPGVVQFNGLARTKARSRVGHCSTPGGCGNAGNGCTPECTWKCGTAKCDEVCTPKCAPPRCQTRCQIPDLISTKTCKLNCGQSNCAVVCPKQPCSRQHGCPSCQAKCGQPACKLNCTAAPVCRDVCENPICEWNCTKPTACPQPNCTMTCGTAKMCSRMTYKDMPPLQNNEVVVNSFAASPANGTNGTNQSQGGSFLSVPMQVAVHGAPGSKARFVHRTVYLQADWHYR